MTKMTEGKLQITFPRGTSARKFDDPKSHGLSHCMKAVDFIVEEDHRILFIEFKDPEHPDAQEDKREEFVDNLLAGRLDEDLKHKYRDTFLYEWAAGDIGKPIHYWVLVAMDRLTDEQLLTRTDQLKRKLPLYGPDSGAWTRQVVASCVVFNICTWNRYLPDFPVSRV